MGDKSKDSLVPNICLNKYSQQRRMSRISDSVINNSPFLRSGRLVKSFKLPSKNTNRFSFDKYSCDDSIAMELQKISSKSHVLQSDRMYEKLYSDRTMKTISNLSKSSNKVNFSRGCLDLRAQFNEQSKCLEGKLDVDLTVLNELQEFYRRRAAVEQDYSDALNKLVNNLKQKHINETSKFFKENVSGDETQSEKQKSNFLLA